MESTQKYIESLHESGELLRAYAEVRLEDINDNDVLISVYEADDNVVMRFINEYGSEKYFIEPRLEFYSSYEDFRIIVPFMISNIIERFDYLKTLAYEVINKIEDTSIILKIKRELSYLDSMIEADIKKTNLWKLVLINAQVVNTHNYLSILINSRNVKLDNGIKVYTKYIWLSNSVSKKTLTEEEIKLLAVKKLESEFMLMASSKAFDKYGIAFYEMLVERYEELNSFIVENYPINSNDKLPVKVLSDIEFDDKVNDKFEIFLTKEKVESEDIDEVLVWLEFNSNFSSDKEDFEKMLEYRINRLSKLLILSDALKKYNLDEEQSSGLEMKECFFLSVKYLFESIFENNSLENIKSIIDKMINDISESFKDVVREIKNEKYPLDLIEEDYILLSVLGKVSHMYLEKNESFERDLLLCQIESIYEITSIISKSLMNVPKEISQDLSHAKYHIMYYLSRIVELSNWLVKDYSEEFDSLIIEIYNRCIEVIPENIINDIIHNFVEDDKIVNKRVRSLNVLISKIK